jgi:Flp pilus assembly protein TadD
MRPFVTLTFLLALSAGAPLAAQYVQPLPQMTPPGDADALAAQVRALAANPSDLYALIRAGELALKLDDASAAASLFARAERIDPRNGRVKAGLGVLLVQTERPGEALRRFAEAESFGARADTFAADRGLAYDLIGEQERAQRDYRLALKSGPNDETTRRYALSLGISGKREEALALLDPLLRKSDRGAWRARAFILAMSGNRVDAEQIATTMMPAGMSQGLQPFFDRLPTLSPVDRAFAVHFGETRPSAQRFADARMIPPLPPLGVDPDARELALAAQAREKSGRAPATEVARPAKRKRGRREPVELAVQAAAPPVALALPTPPAYVDPAAATRSNAAPGAGAYYVQRLPNTRPPLPTYSPVAQANRASAVAAAAPVPVVAAPVVTQTQVMPSYQPVQRVTGRVMPVAPLQPLPLPSSVVAQTGAPSRSWVPATTAARDGRVAPSALVASVTPPPVETSTRVEPTAPYVAPVSAVPVPASVVPAEVATRVERTPSATVGAVPATTAPPVVSQPYPLAAAPAAAPTVVVTPAAFPPTPVATAGVSYVPGSVTAPKVEDSAPSTLRQTNVPAAERDVAPIQPAIRSAPLVARVAEPVRAAPSLSAIRAPVKPVVEVHRRPVSEDAARSEPDEISDRKIPGFRAGVAGRKADAEPDLKKPAGKKAAGTKTSDTRKDDTAEGDVSERGKKAIGKKSGAKKLAEPDDEVVDAKTAGSKKRGDRNAESSRTRGDVEDGGDAKSSDGKKRADKKGRAAKQTVDDDEADAKASDGKKRTDRKGLNGKKGSESKKKDAKPEEPSRVWVQVSGGANENDLPKQWNKLRSDQPSMFKGRSGYSTPLRATNRILTGPFASEAEAQSYVNKLAKQGVSGFVFKSDAGQKVNKLPTK